VITEIYICDLCKKKQHDFKFCLVDFSGCGALKFSTREEVDKMPSERKIYIYSRGTIVCRNCIHGLGYAMSHIPPDPDDV
jgi:hypothetical protein